MMNKILLVLIPAFCLAPGLNALAVTPGIIGPDMEIIDNDIIVSLSIDNIGELESTIKSGIGKEIVFTVELMRSWIFWPDEFVVSKKIEKMIKYDNLRDKYLAASSDGIHRTNESIDDYSTVKSWLFSAKHINLANMKELEPGSYYIRVIVESKSLEQLPFIGFLMHFIPEVEMSMAKETGLFIVEENK